MEQKSMTALVSAFSRAYHSLNNKVTIFNDSVARQLLTDEEYRQIAKSMSDGIGFFNPSFVGEPEQALRWIVDNQLSPPPLGRAAFAEKSLERAVQVGAKQYLIFGAGYDTFAYCQPSWADTLEIFEIDHTATASDKQERLKNANLVIPNNVHYIEADFTKEAWEEAGERAKKQSMLAGAANEKMLASYSYCDMERLLSAHDFLIYEHLTPQEMTEQYFEAYNKANPSHRMTAFDNVNYCLAVRK